MSSDIRFISRGTNQPSSQFYRQEHDNSDPYLKNIDELLLCNQFKRVLDFSYKKPYEKPFQLPKFRTIEKTAPILSRTLPKNPHTILDAPNLSANIEERVISASNTHLWIMLDSKMNSYNHKTAKLGTTIIKPSSIPSNTVDRSLLIFAEGDYIALSSSNQYLSIADTKQAEYIRHLRLLDDAYALASTNSTELLAGLDSGSIIHLDLRHRTLFPPLLIGAHKARISSLSVHNNFIASGGTDNAINIWDLRKPGLPIISFNDYKAPIRALNWSKTHLNGLLSGGDSQDPTIKLYDINLKKLICSVNTGSQITNIFPSDNGSSEFITCHGDTSKDIKLWKIVSNRIELKSASPKQMGKIISAAITPDATTLITGISSTEIIGIWDKIFEPKPISLSEAEPFEREIR